ncbi:hypothetical protein BN2537_17363 [Streptomyces venezuelae]|nr:hypothetical protein BN2537_17363 [Streptomyces venezuelae]
MQGAGGQARLEVVGLGLLDLVAHHVEDLLAVRAGLEALLVGEVDVGSVDPDHPESGVGAALWRSDGEGLHTGTGLLLGVGVHVEKIQEQQVVLLVLHRAAHRVAGSRGWSPSRPPWSGTCGGLSRTAAQVESLLQLFLSCSVHLVCPQRQRVSTETDDSDRSRVRPRNGLTGWALGPRPGSGTDGVPQRQGRAGGDSSTEEPEILGGPSSTRQA